MLAVLLLISAVYQIASANHSNRHNVCPTLKSYATIGVNKNCWYNPNVGSNVIAPVGSNRDNVCATLWDYVTVASGRNTNCWYNPNVRSNVRDIVQRNGYPVEEYHVKTEDGYILVVFRILNGNSTDRTKRQPVIIQHGIQGSAGFWVLQDRKSIGLFLVDQGYDVWLPTLRGSAPSTEHVSLSATDPDFWDFGLDELALYDLVAIVEYVANITSQKGNIIYIGHSMGSTISYIYASERTQHASEYLKGMISLGPVAFLNHIDPSIKRLILRYGPVFENTADIIGIEGTGQIPFVEDFFRKFCGLYPVVVLCEALLKLTSGVNPKENTADMIPTFFSYYPTGVSIKVVKMYLQNLLQGGRFAKYSYGSEKNIRLYGSETTPEYNISNINLPVFLLLGKYDPIATEKDVDALYKILNSPRSKGGYAVKYVLDFAHNDFVIGKNLDQLHRKLLEFMAKLGST